SRAARLPSPLALFRPGKSRAPVAPARASVAAPIANRGPQKSSGGDRKCGQLFPVEPEAARRRNDEDFGESSSDPKTGAAGGKTCPLISPPGLSAVWMLRYQRPENRSVMSWIMSGGSAVAQPFFGAPAGRGIRTGALTPGGAGKWK